MGRSVEIYRHGMENEQRGMRAYYTVSNYRRNIYLSNTFRDSLSVTLLQVNDVSQNVLARTAVMAAFLFAIAGLALGARLITRLPQFHKKNGRNAWDKVCTLLFYSKFAQLCL
jgi:hypothetical protein